MKQKENVSVGTVKTKEIKLTTLLAAALLAIIAGLAILLFSVYAADSEMKKVAFLPAVVVDGARVVSFGQLDSNLAAMRKFYETQDYSTVGLRVDFTTEEGRKRLLVKERELLDKLVEDRFVEILAKENGIRISQADIDQSVQRKLDEYGSKNDVVKDLDEHYGWTIEDFKREIVAPDIYREALAKKVEELNAEANKKAEGKIKQAQKDLQGGEDFAQVARKYSDGSTAADGGELGWVKQEQLMPTLAEALFGTNKPERFAIVESPLGYHMLDVEEKKKDGNEDVLRIRQVFVRKNTFADWLDGQIKARKVLVLIKGFAWDKNSGTVEFSKPEMRQFEKTVLEQNQGDASLLF